MKDITLNAYAKVNLGLDVIRKREDGYHEVRMIMQTVNIYDRIKIQKTKEPGIQLKTNLTYLPVNEDNIVYKAVHLLKEEFHIETGVEIELEKCIPVAAGMAGGSSDAAAALKGMNELFQLNLSKEQLMKQGVKLGADVPYCIMGGTALSEGIGEKLTALPPAPNCYTLIAKPPISVSTRYVYENLDINNLEERPDIDGIINAIKGKDLHGVASRLYNVLETVTVREYVEINRIKQEMIRAGALNSIMSGSGPTVFGLFDNKDAAERAYKRFKGGSLANQVFLTKFVAIEDGKA